MNAKELVRWGWNICDMCHRSADAKVVAVLSDDTSLCEQCLEVVSKEEANDFHIRSVRESMRVSYRDIFLGFAVVNGSIAIAFFGILLVIPGIIAGDLLTIFLQIAAMCFVLTPLTLLMSAYYARIVFQRLPEIAVVDERVLVTYGNRDVKAELSECHWHYGRMHDTRLFRGFVIYSRLPVIILEVPTHSPFEGNMRVAIGQSSAMSWAWQSLLTRKIGAPDKHGRRTLFTFR